MTESDLLMLHIELLNNVWSIRFTWVGTTTAMIGAAYFVAARIKIGLVSALLGLCSFFTAACAAQIFRAWGRVLGVREDLVALEESGVKLSHSANLLVANIDSRLVANAAGSLCSSAVSSMLSIVTRVEGLPQSASKLYSNQSDALGENRRQIKQHRALRRIE